MTKTRRKLCASGAWLALAAALPAPSAAQTVADEDQGDPVVIVVTGQGLPDTPATPAYSTREIPRDELIAAPSGRIEDALATVAGFQQFRRSDSRSSNPSAQGATLRALGGNASSRAQVLLDGVPMADPFFGYIPFSAIAGVSASCARSKSEPGEVSASRRFAITLALRAGLLAEQVVSCEPLSTSISRSYGNPSGSPAHSGL